MHKKNIGVHERLCRGIRLRDAVLSHQRLEVRALHIDLTSRLRHVPAVSHESLFDKHLFNFLDGRFPDFLLEILELFAVLRHHRSDGKVGLVERSGNMDRFDLVSLNKYCQALNRMLQLAHVSWPVIVHHQFHGFWLHARYRSVDGVAVLAKEVLEELRNIFPAFAQRGQSNGEHIQPVVQILPKLPARDELLEILIRGKDQADVHLLHRGAPDGQKLPFLEDSEQPGLRLQRQVPDLVEEDRAVIGHFKYAWLISSRAGKRTFHVSEQFALQ